ncbi:MAG: ABC transporter ATP-binding protein [Rhodospirillaceae bacterium]|nr:ABC transporter ATP-binding protein [Rhodospirillales bacterium]
MTSKPATRLSRFGKRLPLRDLGRILALFGRRYPMATGIVVSSLLFANVLDGLGILTILPLLAVATNPGQAPSGIGGRFFDAFHAVGLEPSLGMLLSLMVTIVIVKSWLTWLGMKYVGYAMARVQTDLRLDFINAMLRARWSYFTSMPAGRLTAAAGQEPERAATAIFYGISMLVVVIQGLVYVGATFLVAPVVALGAVVTGAFMMTALSWYMRMARTAGENQTKFLHNLMNRFVDAVQGIKPIKAMALESRFLPLLEHETQGLNRAMERHVVATTAVRAFQEPLATVVMAAGLYVSLTSLNVAITEVMVMALLFWRAVQAVGGFQKIGQAMVAGESALWALLKVTKDAHDAAERISGHAPPPLADAIRFDNVVFAHGERSVLDGLSIEIPANRITAIVGPSGTGKTTVADLTLGLHLPQQGVIRVDDVSLGEIDIHAWRQQVGYVPQETSLFAESILVNITLGDPALGPAEAEAALRAAGAWDFVAALPQGLDTPAGERGQQLSGGQRQRIAIARALVRKPRLLILDESTTALDPETEAAICATLRELSQGVTILAISHQPAIMGVAHRVYELAGGRVLRHTDGEAAQ